MLFLIFITKNMKEESGFLITYGPLRALRDDFSYIFLSIPLNFKLLLKSNLDIDTLLLHGALFCFDFLKKYCEKIESVTNYK